MKKYVCSICGYIYDEQKERVKFDDLPSGWTCPLCGAPKSAFRELAEEIAAAKPIEKAAQPLESDDRELTNAELNAMCTNLAKGCEKQYKTEDAQLFGEIAEYYKNHSERAKDSELESVTSRLNYDLEASYPEAFGVARAEADRGALRILTWSEKVSKIVASLIERYKKEGTAFLANTKIFVCEICGFIYLGDQAPEICPICKVPRFKIHEVGRA